MYAMREMRDSLAGIVAEVRNGTSTIALASSEIASGNLDLSSRTERQAASLEETGAAMVRLTSTVDRNADSARKSNAMVLEASNAAAKGGQVMDAVVDTMGVIAQSARKIADIIGVIDAIAFQTNILALNASVEAARAGAEGRGFAVVAAEVRNLAQRSAAAAKEIKQLIEGSVQQVDEGNRLVSKAGETMDEIASSVQRVTGMMGEILSVSQDQGSGIAQVNHAIEQMDQVTQSNAALVEQAAAAAASLQDQAMRLTQSVSVFKLETAAAPDASVPQRVASNVRAASARRVRSQPAGLLTNS
jgi:methyl-accepting chemotaxis protein